MKRLLPLLLVGASFPAIAQTRVRPMGEFRGARNGARYLVTFEARSSGELIIDASETVAPSFHSSAHCVVAPDSIVSWADSAADIVRMRVSPPRAPEKIEFDGPEIPYASCIVKVNRTVTVSGSEYSLLIVDRPPMLPTSVAAPVTQTEALTFIAKVREAATIAVAMTPRSPAAADSSLLDVRPSDPPISSTSVSTGGIDFPYPGYLENVTRQIALRFQTSSRGNLRADVSFLINRDGTVPSSSIRLVTRSGAYSFDADAQGAVETAANAHAFGPLPAGYAAESLPVTFRFDPNLSGSTPTATSESVNYPPQPTGLFVPPLPVPDKVRGFYLVAEFDVDDTGRVLDYSFSPTSDREYNKRLDELFRRMSFRPGTKPDGTPVRSKAHLAYEF